MTKNLAPGADPREAEKRKARGKEPDIYLESTRNGLEDLVETFWVGGLELADSYLWVLIVVVRIDVYTGYGGKVLEGGRRRGLVL